MKGNDNIYMLFIKLIFLLYLLAFLSAWFFLYRGFFNIKLLNKNYVFDLLVSVISISVIKHKTLMNLITMILLFFDK
jgi:hypothetical protein